MIPESQGWPSSLPLTLFERAELLGVNCSENDYEKLLAVVHEHESKLMELRHDIQRRIAGITPHCGTDR